MYNLQQGKQTHWVNYDDMTEYLDLVIAYERQRKNKNTHSGWKKPEASLPPIQI